MQPKRRTAVALFCIGVAFLLQGCGKTIMQNFQPQINAFIETGCKTAVDAMTTVLTTLKTQSIETMCAGLTPACSSYANTNADAQIEIQKANQTAACTAKMQAMFNGSSLPDMTAISEAASKFEFGQKGWEEGWLKGQLDAITAQAQAAGGKVTPASTKRLYIAAPQQSDKKAKDASSPLPMMGLGVASVMLVGSIAFGVKRFSASRGAADEVCDDDAEAQEEEIE